MKDKSRKNSDIHGFDGLPSVFIHGYWPKFIPREYCVFLATVVMEKYAVGLFKSTGSYEKHESWDTPVWTE